MDIHIPSSSPEAAAFKPGIYEAAYDYDGPRFVWIGNKEDI